MKKDIIKIGTKRALSYIQVSLNQNHKVEMSGETAVKKRKLRGSSRSGNCWSTDALPELYDADETLTQEVQNRTVDRPDNAETELSFIHTLSKDELNDHIQKCLEMSSENRITPKNAFALQLIDCMNILLQKEDFSAMACTLDAGTKIYSYRVDSLHQQVIKLAEEVIQNQRKKNKDSDGETREREVNTDASAEKLNRKIKKKNILAAPDALKRKMKGKDPRDKYIRVDALPGAIINNVRRNPKDFSFTMENNIEFWRNCEDYLSFKAEGSVILPMCQILRDKETSKAENNVYFEAFSSNLVTDIIVEHDEIAMEENVEELSPEIYIPDNLGNSQDSDVQYKKAMENEVDTKSPEIEVDVVSTAMKRLNREAEATGEMFSAPSRFEAMKIIFNQVSEYHYLDMKKANYWAGPDFWKRPKVGSQNEVKKPTLKRKKKEPGEITYNRDNIDDLLAKPLRRGPSLARGTVLGWKSKKLVYPTDMKYDVHIFLELFNISRNNEAVESYGETEHLDPLQNEETSPYTQDPTEVNEDPMNTPSSQNLKNSFTGDLNHSFYEGAPGTSDSSDERDPLNSTFYDVGMSQIHGGSQDNKDTGIVVKVKISDETLPLSESYLVPAPKVVQFKPIQYSTRPIRVDMKHLKETMLVAIDEEIRQNSSSSQSNPSGDDTNSPAAKFSNILKKLPANLEKRTAADLSPAMAFLALLTLANENNLQLKNCEGLMDVMICRENLKNNHKNDPNFEKLEID